ncbi:sensor domain-containing phosphodiesterase [Brucella pituitosa]|uniref:sensor domain-containing phosphodiesterase n=1 Tax=Brucella pituitosa TaxID=571256 RepID=UPI003C78B41F
MLKFQNSVLELIARGKPLKQTLMRLCLEMETLIADASAMVCSVDSAGMMHLLAAPSIPDSYSDVLDGTVVGPDVGSCGSAIYHNAPISVDDIENDPKWATYKKCVLPFGLLACSSVPVHNEAGDVVGALAVYFHKKHMPSAYERDVIDTGATLCNLAMAREMRILNYERRATVDEQTALPNRAAFDDALSQLRCELAGSWALFVIDIDNLKVTNDTFGHEVGDFLINTIASRISASMAPDITFRTGGDEFTVVIQSHNALYDLDQTAELIFSALSSPVEFDGQTILPRVTIGGAVLAAQDTQPLIVRRNADFALYHAKENARGGFVRYQPNVDTRIVHRRNSIREVREALDEKRITAHYQPLMRLDTREVIGFEALSRMTTKSGDILPASVFQESFSDVHIASEITQYMLTIVAQDIRRWLDMGLPVQHVGVNVTAADFYVGDLAAFISKTFGRYDVPLSHLIIEVTENAYIGQRDDVVASGIRNLRLLGVRIALDDFGTGFAALAHLLTVPVDIIKIDKSFVCRLAPGDPSVAIVKGIVQIAGDLKIKLVAEGVETMALAETLQQMGCQLGQGYAFSKAVNYDKATTLLLEHGQYVERHPIAEPRPLKAIN